MIQLRTLGRVELIGEEGADLPAILTQSKRLALLVYLALPTPGTMHRRDIILGLFWPELDHAKARTGLRNSLSRLRHILGDGAILRRGDEEVGLNPELAWCDVTAFDAAFREKAWDTALELYRGDFLEGFFVKDARGFERWADDERTRLREAAAGAAWARAHQHLEANRDVDAERTAQRALSLVPTDESEVRRFAQALSDAGDRAAAIRFYEKFVQRLRDEYDVEPSPETVALAEAIRERGAAVRRVDSPALTVVQADASTAGEAPSTRLSEPKIAAIPVRRRRGRQRWVVGAGAAVVMVLLLRSLGVVGSAHPPPRATIHSVAAVTVLPFSDLDERAGPDHFAAGLTEDLITRLSQVRALRVISSEAAARHVNDGATVGELGDLLGVDAVIRGTVRRQADSARVTVQLIDVSTEEYIWAAGYNRALSDVLATQGEIAISIATAMNAGLSEGEEQRLRSVPTLNLAAWEYAEAAKRVFIGGGDRSHVPQLIGRALELDSTLSLAHALQSVWLTNLAAQGPDPRLLDSAETEALRAVALDPENHLAHAALGYARRFYAGQYQQLQPLVRSVELAPSTYEARSILASYFGTRTGRIDLTYGWQILSSLHNPSDLRGFPAWSLWLVGDYRAAEHRWSMMLAVNPAAMTHARMAQLYLSQGKSSEAEDQVMQALARNPARTVFDDVLTTAALVDIFAGDFESAEARLEEAMNLDPPVVFVNSNGVRTTTALAYVLWKQGETERAGELLERSIRQDSQLVNGGIRYAAHPHYDMARAYAILGDVEEANRWLREALDVGWPFAYTYMGPADPMLENLRGNEDFQAMMAEARAELDRQREHMRQMDTMSPDELFSLLLQEAYAELELLRREESPK